MSESRPLLCAPGIRQGFFDRMQKREIAVVADVSVRIARGESVAFIGPNGCGKSTFLNILGGIERCDQGEVMIADQSRIGYIQQHDSLLPWMSIAENCALPLLLHRRCSAAERERRARALLERLALAE